MTEERVLRTVYLERAVDRRLKRIARSRGVTKNQLIRDLLVAGLPAYQGMTIGERLEASLGDSEVDTA